MKKSLIAVVPFALGTLISVTAHAIPAQVECSTDADCGDGFACQVIGGSSTSCSSDQPDCDPTYTETYGCVPVPVQCDADSDCTDGFTCESFTWEACEGGGAVPLPDCAPGSDCPEPEPMPEPTCESITESYCAPPYAGACTADADCGEGFTCIEAESCWCDGSEGRPVDPDEIPPSEGSGAADPGEPLPEEPNCGCEPSGEFYCQMAEIECAADSDCPTDWTCSVSGDTAVPCYFDEATGEEVCGDPMPSVSYCMPPYFDSFVSQTGDGLGGGAFEEAAANDVATRGNTDDVVVSKASDEDGCSATGATPAPAGFLLMLGALLGIRRRRTA